MQAEVGLHNITFPVYKIGNTKPLEQDGVHYYAYGKDFDTEDEESEVKLVDDKNIDKPTLALRRLHLKNKEVKLHKLSTAIFFIGDLIKAAEAKTWFIDTEGTVFQYKKSVRVKLIFRPIEQVLPIQSGGAIIAVKGIPARFKTLFTPEPEKRWAGLLLIKNSYILYGLYTEEHENTVRMI